MRKKQEVVLEDFEYTEVDKGIFKETVDFDIDATHEKVWQEMSLQQSKRDQLLMIYLAALAFIFPSLLSDNNLNSLASGIVFMLIMLSSLAGMKSGQIPLTLILVAVLYLGQEIHSMLFIKDNVANFMHLVGGACGTLVGFSMVRRRF